ncbi:MAG: helix-turn-helix domain-containing protein [bacterium]
MFNKRLKQLRKENNLTQKELSEILNIGESTLSHYENKDREPNFDTLIKIADLFDVSLDYLLGRR